MKRKLRKSIIEVRDQDMGSIIYRIPLNEISRKQRKGKKLLGETFGANLGHCYSMGIKNMQDDFLHYAKWYSRTSAPEFPSELQLPPGVNPGKFAVKFYGDGKRANDIRFDYERQYTFRDVSKDKAPFSMSPIDQPLLEIPHGGIENLFRFTKEDFFLFVKEMESQTNAGSKVSNKELAQFVRFFNPYDHGNSKATKELDLSMMAVVSRLNGQTKTLEEGVKDIEVVSNKLGGELIVAGNEKDIQYMEFQDGLIHGYKLIKYKEVEHGTR